MYIENDTTNDSTTLETETDNTPVDTSDDLDAFSNDLFGHKPEDEGATPTDKDEVDGGEDSPEEDEEEGTQPEEEEAKASKPKSRFQERIDELTSKAREAERREAQVASELEEVKRKLAELTPGAAKPAATNTSPFSSTQPDTGGPTPTDLNEDGTDKYPLGEFDPSFIKDLTRFTIAQEREASEREAKARAEAEARTKEEEALTTEWNAKLGPASERYPDFQRKGAELINAFAGVPQDYGEFLTKTLMGMEYGPDVFYELATNLEEAKRIVDLGPTKAALALGRIEARFANAANPKAAPKVSKAPTPPARLNKGSAQAMPDVPGDTDDLDAFSRQFFKKR